MGSPVPSSSKSKSPAVAATAPTLMPTHQLPPVVHAIGASIGSALSILAFYPFERIRVELQSQGEGGDAARNITRREADEGRDNDRGSDENNHDINIKHNIEYKNEHQANDDMNNTTTAEHLQDIEVKREEFRSTPDSSVSSFEVVSSLRSADDDVVSLGTSSYYDNEPTDLNLLDGKEDDSNEGIAPGGQLRQTGSEESGPANYSASGPRYSNIDEDISAMLYADNKNQKRGTKPPDSRKESRDRKPPPSDETILQCLLRLHSEQTLYKGVSHVVTTLMISNAIFFYALQVTRRSLTSVQQQQQRHDHQRTGKQKQHPLQHFLKRILPKSNIGNSLLASSLAGIINVLLTNPLWVASLRIMESKAIPANQDESSRRTRQQQSLWSVMHRIATDEGVSRLWNGTQTSLLLVSNPIIQHCVYEQLRSRYMDNKRRKRAGLKGHGSSSGGKYHHGVVGNNVSSVEPPPSLSPVEAFVFGALAKTVATLATYPLQLAQVLLRLQRKKNQSSQLSCDNDESSQQHDKSIKHGDDRRAYEGTMDCLYKQFSRGGFPALFKGMNAKLLQTVMTAAFTFLTYEQILTGVAQVYETLGLKRTLLH